MAYVFPIAKGAQNVTSNGQELLAYTKANNLYYVDANGNEFAVTSDEDPNIVNGQTVSRNEFGINGGIFWSPDGKQLAFYRKDESQVGTFPFAGYQFQDGDFAGDQISYGRNEIRANQSGGFIRLLRVRPFF